MAGGHVTYSRTKASTGLENKKNLKVTIRTDADIALAC